MVTNGLAPDLADLLLADRALIAEKLDSKQITQEQANAVSAQAAAAITEMAQDRANRRTAAVAAALSAMPPAALTPFPQQPPIQTQFYPIQIPQSHSFNCYTYGNMTNCN